MPDDQRRSDDREHEDFETTLHRRRLRRVQSVGDPLNRSSSEADLVNRDVRWPAGQGGPARAQQSGRTCIRERGYQSIDLVDARLIVRSKRSRRAALSSRVSEGRVRSKRVPNTLIHLLKVFLWR